MSRSYLSPLTGDAWPDPRVAVGTLAGLATFLNEQRPRRRPPEGHDEAIALAVTAAAALAGVPRIQRFGATGLTLEEGIVISDAYWKAKDAKVKLQAIVDDGLFLDRQRWWGEMWARVQAGSVDQWDRLQLQHYSGAPVSTSMHAARVAWYAANLAEKFAGGTERDMDTRSYAHDATLGALAEVDETGISREVAAGVERVWRFVVAAGRMPRPGIDDDLLAAFEAALLADEHEFAGHLAREGWGQGNGGVDGTSA